MRKNLSSSSCSSVFLFTPVAYSTPGGSAMVQICNQAWVRTKCSATASAGDVQVNLEWRCYLHVGSQTFTTEHPPTVVRDENVSYSDSVFATGTWKKCKNYTGKNQSVWRPSPDILLDHTDYDSTSCSGGGGAP